jgi:hypothetical protein
MLSDSADLSKKKNQMKFRLTLIRILSDPNIKLQQVSVWPTENNLNNISFSYYKNDNTTPKK